VRVSVYVSMCVCLCVQEVVEGVRFRDAEITDTVTRDLRIHPGFSGRKDNGVNHRIISSLSANAIFFC